MKQLDLFDSFQDNLNEAERVYLEAQKKYYAAKKLRDDNCEHLEVEQKSEYFDGSYYNKAFTERWEECKICGAKSKVRREIHSWYG